MFSVKYKFSIGFIPFLLKVLLSQGVVFKALEICNSVAIVESLNRLSNMEIKEQSNSLSYAKFSCEILTSFLRSFSTSPKSLASGLFVYPKTKY